jgi:hypothetical protein
MAPARAEDQFAGGGSCNLHGLAALSLQIIHGFPRLLL